MLHTSVGRPSVRRRTGDGHRTSIGPRFVDLITTIVIRGASAGGYVRQLQMHWYGRRIGVKDYKESTNGGRAGSRWTK
jgi:hypothetical protein